MNQQEKAHQALLSAIVRGDRTTTEQSDKRLADITPAEAETGDWAFVHHTLIECQKKIEADGSRQTWIIPAIDIAKARSSGAGDEQTLYALAADQHATIVAALRFYQEMGLGEPSNRNEAIHDLATNGDAVISLGDDGIDALVDQLQFGGVKQEDEVSVSTKRQQVRLADGYNGHTALFDAEPIESNGNTFKLRCAEAGKGHLVRWVTADDLQKALRSTDARSDASQSSAAELLRAAHQSTEKMREVAAQILSGSGKDPEERSVGDSGRVVPRMRG